MSHPKPGSVPANKDSGTLYEAAFNYQAQRRGCGEVFLSQSDNSAIDAVISSPMGQLYRVQIKGSRQEKAISIAPFRGRGKTRRYLDPKKYEVLAVYAAIYEMWYLIPSERVGKAVRLKIWPMFKNSKGQYEVYRENWKIFK